MTMKLWHCKDARSLRPLWALEEMDMPYELETLPFPPRALRKTFLGTNPLGTVPYFTDGDVRMTESSGICLYLVDRYDRYDLGLGTPAETIRLATSEGRHSDAFQLVIEDTMESSPYWGGAHCAEVRSDLVYLEPASGGAVFSVGSINWIASLPHNGFQNNVSRITGNVLRRFAGLDGEKEHS